MKKDKKHKQRLSNHLKKQEKEKKKEVEEAKTEQMEEKSKRYGFRAGLFLLEGQVAA